MKLKLLVDMVMTALLPCQMAYMLIGETAHEWMGTAMLVMFIVHNILNRKWYGNLFKGRYSAGRVLRIGVNSNGIPFHGRTDGQRNHPVEGGVCIPAAGRRAGLCRGLSTWYRLIGDLY